MSSDSPKLPRTLGRGADAEAREAARRARQAQALRENLKRRKAQARAAREPKPDLDGGDASG